MNANSGLVFQTATIVTITEGGSLPFSGIFVTNVFQQINTYLYDASGKTVTVSNVLGEKTTATFDALGRTVQAQTFAAGSGTPLRVSAIAFAADNNSFTATSGTGANAISSTTYLDTEGRSLLTIATPTAGMSNLALRKYDLAGNLTSETQASLQNNSLTTWQTTAYTYDGLNQVKTLTERDNAVTTFGFDPVGKGGALRSAGRVRCFRGCKDASPKTRPFAHSAKPSWRRVSARTFFEPVPPTCRRLVLIKTGQATSRCLVRDDD